ncbi:MAG TPA: aldose 1-epimerase family protein [Pirellulales bacterium]|jgi:galactose mutarotase-like enzyme
MVLRTWNLVDAERGVYLPTLKMVPADIVGPQVVGLRAQKRTIQGGPGDGLDVVEISNGPTRLAVLPGRGMGIWKAWCSDIELSWRSPIRGPVNPKHVNLFEGSGIGWLAGFDELICRCGLESNGAPEWDDQGRLKYPLHGKIANTPAHLVDVSADGDTGEVTVRGVVDESRLFGRKLRLTSTVQLTSMAPGFAVYDEVTNLSSEPTDFELLYHINFGVPTLTPGARIIAPVKEMAPRDPHSATDTSTWHTYGEPKPGLEEFVHYFRMTPDRDGVVPVLLKFGPDRGIVLRYEIDQLPCFTLWKCQQPASDGYVTGLEPGTNFPNVRSYEEKQNRTAKLAPGASRSFSLDFEIVSTAERMAAIEADIKIIAGDTPPKIFDKPQAGWAPEGDE